jgi:hypothetical protein
MKREKNPMKRNLILASLILLASLVAFGADIAGSWSIQARGSGAPEKLVLTTVNGKVLNGSIDGRQVLGGGYKNNEFWFNSYHGNSNFQYKGTYSGDTLKLTETTPDNKVHTYSFTRVTQ